MSAKKNKSKLCEYGIYSKNGMEEFFICDIGKINCAYVRWCAEDSCLKMKEKYLKCNGRKIMEKKDLEKEKIDEVEIITKSKKYSKEVKLSKKKTKKEKCKILWIDKNKIGFDFMGYGVWQFTDNKIEGKIVEVEYQGTIGKHDFEIINLINL